MAKEEEKAIENLTKLLKQRNEKQVKITTYNLFENIETVLSMLKENSAEIEKKNTELAEKSAEIEKYKYLYQKALDNTIKADRENIQLKKQIDLMADFIDKTGAGRRAFSCTFRKNDECNENGCKYCIKKYFDLKGRNNERRTNN